MEELFGFEFERPILQLEAKIAELKSLTSAENIDFGEELSKLEDRLDNLRHEIYDNLTPWQRVQISRHPRRPYTLDYVTNIFEDFFELHGDRTYADDKAIIAGLAKFDGQTVAVVGHQKGRTVQESMERNFGMPHPEGYRKALRVMRLGSEFGFPIITFIDTPGAYPGIGAEERGQAEAIARNLMEMSRMPVPIICIIIGEGGSGGALGIGVGDLTLMLENAWYSVISPEGCAAILFRDVAKAPDAAGALQLTAQNLKKLGIVDEIVPEPLGGSHREPEKAYENLKKVLLKYMPTLKSLSKNQLLETRYKRLRNTGTCNESKNGAGTVNGFKKNRKIQPKETKVTVNV